MGMTLRNWRRRLEYRLQREEAVLRSSSEINELMDADDDERAFVVTAAHDCVISFREKTAVDMPIIKAILICRP